VAIVHHSSSTTTTATTTPVPITIMSAAQRHAHVAVLSTSPSTSPSMASPAARRDVALSSDTRSTSLYAFALRFILCKIPDLTVYLAAHPFSQYDRPTSSFLPSFSSFSPPSRRSSSLPPPRLSLTRSSLHTKLRTSHKTNSHPLRHLFSTLSIRYHPVQ
jgi:hypothetical protein